MAVLHSRGSFSWLCLLLLCAWPKVSTEWLRLEGITVESPSPASLLKQGHPGGPLRPCLIVASHTVKWHLRLQADLLTATGRNLELLRKDELHNAATSD